jgi:DNA-nicking Smr family endonuclease
MSKRRKKVGNDNTKKTAGDSRFSVLTDEKDTYNPFKGLKKEDVVTKAKIATNKNNKTQKAKSPANPNLKKVPLVETFDEDITFEDIFSSWENGRSVDNVKKKSKNTKKSEVQGDEDFASVFAQWENSQGIAPKAKKTPPKKSDNYKPTKDFGQLLDQFEGNGDKQKIQKRQNVNQILKRTDEDVLKSEKVNNKNQIQTKSKAKNLSDLPKNYKIISQSASVKKNENNKNINKNRNNKFENKNRNTEKKINNEQTTTTSNKNGVQAFTKVYNNKKSGIKKVEIQNTKIVKDVLNSHLEEKEVIIKTSFDDNIMAAKELAAKELAAKELAAKELAAKELAAKELAAKELAAKELAAKELAAKELAAKELAAKELAAKELATKELATKELAAKELAAKELAAKELAAKELAAKELATKELVQKESSKQKNLSDKVIEKNDDTKDKKCSWNVDSKITDKYLIEDEVEIDKVVGNVVENVLKNVVPGKTKKLDNTKNRNRNDVCNAKNNNDYKKKDSSKKRAPFVVESKTEDEVPSKWNFSDIYRAWSSQNEEEKAILEAKKLKDKKENKGISISYLRSMSPQDEIDLHGLTSDLALLKTREFLEQSRDKGMKKVSIITGKGIHSKDGKGILQDVALSEIRLSGIVREAYNPKAMDGGSGAIWVIFKSTTDKKVYF